MLPPVTCACGKSLTTDDKNGGRRTKCPKCGADVTFFPDPALEAFKALELEPEDSEVDVPTPHAPLDPDASGILARLEELERSNAQLGWWLRFSQCVAVSTLLLGGLAVWVMFSHL